MAKEKFALKHICIVIAILIIVGIIVVLIINPPQILARSRDAQRYADVNSLASAINLYLADNKDFFNLKSTNYSSDSQTENYTQIDGSGWLPLNFKSISSGEPFAVLPIDPINNDRYRYLISISPQKKTFEIDCVFESSINKSKMENDSGTNPNEYEIGTDLNILK